MSTAAELIEHLIEASPFGSLAAQNELKIAREYKSFDGHLRGGGPDEWTYHFRDRMDVEDFYKRISKLGKRYRRDVGVPGRDGSMWSVTTAKW